jgi:hypothetical protein
MLLFDQKNIRLSVVGDEMDGSGYARVADDWSCGGTWEHSELE